MNRFQTNCFNVVNHSIPRAESRGKITGQAVYTEDISLPNMAYAMVIRSPYSRASVKEIDLSATQQVPGYLGALLPEETPDTLFNCSGNPPSELLMEDEKLLTTEPKTAGDRILCVAAETMEACRQAAETLYVEYEVRKPYLTIKEALTDGAEPLQPHLSANNIAFARQAVKSDVEKGFRASYVILEDNFTTPVMQHAQLELTACICDFSDGKTLTVLSNSQTIFQERRILARLLALDEKDVRVIKPTVGGGFGARQQLHSQHVIALLSRKLKRPLKQVYSRSEDLCATTVRHGSDMDIKISADKDGKFLSFYTGFKLNTGPYTTHGPLVMSAASRKFQYNVDNYLFDGYTVFTDYLVGGAFRGYGNTQLTFGREIMIDRLARALNMDPVALRLKNHVRVGECFPCATIPVSSCAIEECVRQCQACQAQIDATEGLVDNEDIRQAWGIAFSCHGSGPSTKEGLSSAIVMLNDDGTVNLQVGSSDIGQGSETMLMQIAAETLGLPFSAISITAADTLRTPYDMGTYGSSQTFVCGNAVDRACRDSLEKLRLSLEHIYGTAVTYQNGRFQTIAEGQLLTLTLPEAVRKSMFDPKGNVIIGSASYKAEACPNPFAVCFAKAEYHKKINAVRLLHVIQAADVGTPINRLTVEGQLEGGIAQGVGYALYERMEIDNLTKKTLSTDFLHYRIPTMDDMPQTHVYIAESFEPEGPHGAKSVGELATIAVAPAIVNGVSRASGQEINRLPLVDRFLVLPNKLKEAGPK